MAQSKSLDEAEFWFSSDFLAGDDFFKDKGDIPKNGATGVVGFGGNLAFSTEFPYDFNSLGSNSTRSSPILSVVGFTEAESSDGEDFLVELTRRLGLALAQSSVNETHKFCVPSFSKSKHERILAGSPQSTLSGTGSWSTKSMVSSNGSRTGSSRVSSPLTSMFGARNDNLEPIYASAGQVARINLISDGAIRGYHDNVGLLGSSHNYSASPLRNSNPCFFANQVLTPTLPKFQYVTPDQSVKPHSQCSASMARQVNKVGLSGHQLLHNHPLQQIQNKGRNTGYERGRCGHPLNVSHTAWPPLHVQLQKQQIQHNFPTNSTTRPDILGGSGVKKDSTGTGVFLPRRYNKPSEPRKKAVCPKIVIPAKAAQSANINFGDTNGHAQPCFINGFSPNHAMLARRNAMLAQQRRILRQERAAIPEIRLPQEWTY